MLVTGEDLREASAVYGAQGYIIAASYRRLQIGDIIPISVRQRDSQQKMRVVAEATLAEAIEQQRMVDGPEFNVPAEFCARTLFYRLESD